MLGRAGLKALVDMGGSSPSKMVDMMVFISSNVIRELSLHVKRGWLPGCLPFLLDCHALKALTGQNLSLIHISEPTRPY